MWQPPFSVSSLEKSFFPGEMEALPAGPDNKD